MKLKNILITAVAGVSLLVGATSLSDYSIKGHKVSPETESAIKGELESLKNSLLGSGGEGVAVESADIEYKVGTNPVVNLGKSDLDISKWKTSHIEYSNLDNLNRPGQATAYLDKSNYGKSENRSGQRWKPAGWNNQRIMVDGKSKTVQDRGHLIAYTLTFKLDDHGNYDEYAEGSLDNPLNLTTQSAYSNQVLFQRYEEQVRLALQSGKKVIYQVTPIYGEGELMPRAYELEAITADKKLNFDVMIYNVQPGVEFNYKTGKPKSNPEMVIPK